MPEPIPDLCPRPDAAPVPVGADPWPCVAAAGHFTPSRSLARTTRAAVFAAEGVAVPAEVRFAEAAGDAATSGPRFDVWLRTPDGPWCLPGGPLPVAAGTARPPRTPRDWQAVVDDPVARHRLLWSFADHARPAAWHRLHAHVHGALRATAADGRRCWLRLQWLPQAGAAGLSWPAARERVADDPTAEARTLARLLADGVHPAWDLALQVVGDAEIDALGWVPEDADGWLPEEWVPLQRIGTLVLDRALAADLAAPSPGEAPPRHLPGLEPVATAAPGAAAAAERTALLWRSLGARERRHLAQALRIALAGGTPPRLHAPVVAALAAVDPALAAAVGGPLGVAVPDAAAAPAPVRLEVSPGLSLDGRHARGEGVAGRRVAVLLADGVDTRGLHPLCAALARHGVGVDTVGARIGPVHPAAGEPIAVGRLLEASSPLAWDALVLPAGDDALAPLCADGRVLQWLRSAWRHGRPLFALGGWALADAAGLPRRLDGGAADPGLLVVPHPRDDADPDAGVDAGDGAPASVPGVDELLAALAHGPVDGRWHEPPLV